MRHLVQSGREEGVSLCETPSPFSLFFCHPRECGDPSLSYIFTYWIPACAGMTDNHKDKTLQKVLGGGKIIV